MYRMGWCCVIMYLLKISMLCIQHGKVAMYYTHRLQKLLLGKQYDVVDQHHLNLFDNFS